ncbi:MAG: ATP--cob(I)alamin adenosyltransferase, partial [Oscillospiraceae bacterium]|nr:ATP--cob(I)alamin adenosyltransferase [Oscillospiraceae bacterium]
MDKVYRSKYEAYPFLADAADDLQCDFEILTDRVTSLIGLLRSMCGEAEIREELLEIGTLVYHANPTLRTRMTITQAEVEWLAARTQRLREETAGRCEKFVLPQGSPRGSLA